MILKHRTKIDVREYRNEILKLLDDEGLHWEDNESLMSGVVDIDNVGFLFIERGDHDTYGDFVCTYMCNHDERYFDNVIDTEDITDEILALVISPDYMLIRSKSQAKRRVLEELNR